MVNTKSLLRIKFLIAILTLLTIFLLPTTVSAKLSENDAYIFGQNNILFFDPNGSSLCSGGGDCYIAGTTRDEKLWSALRHVGFTPEQTAGIIGNIVHEGSTPTRQEDAYNYARNNGCNTAEGKPYSIYIDFVSDGVHHSSCMERIYDYYSAGKEVSGIGLGFVQWTWHDRRLGYLEIMSELGLLKYFEGDAYKTYGRYTDAQLQEAIIEETGSDADYWALWCAAIKYIWTEMNDKYTEFFEQTTPADYAAYTAWPYEKCGSCYPGDSGYNERIASAKEYYARYQAGEFDSVENGSAPSATSSSSTSASNKNITIIGDSITNGSTAALSAKMPDATIIAKDSKHFVADTSDNPSGLTILREQIAANTLADTVVYALGTNDSVTSADIKEVVEAAGAGRRIFFVTNYDIINTTKYDNNNKEFTAAVASYNNVKLVDWKNAILTAEGSPTDYIKDETSTAGYAVHPTASGAELFAKTISDTINGSVSTTCTKVSRNITTEKEAVEFVNQFVRDTNKLYGQRYPLINSVSFNVLTSTPADDSEVSPIESIRGEWISKKLITSGERVYGCWGATYCGQCTAVSGWFVGMMTDYTYNLGDGIEVVGKMLYNNPDLTLSKTPTPFSVFSESSDSAAGHTGMVLGDLGNDTYLTMEGNQGNRSIMIKTRSLSSFRNASFLDLSKKVKLEHLGVTYE